LKLDDNQRHVLNSGGWWALYDGLTSGYLIAFALALGASNTVVGVIGALPYLAAMFSEIPGAQLLEYFPRLRIYAVASTISRLSWLGVIAVPFIFIKAPLVAIIAFYFLSKFCDYIADPSWTVLVADVVPVKLRGEFISKRTRLINIFGMVALVAGGYYLDLFRAPSLTGFLTMFAVGIVFGICTTLVTLRVREPLYQYHDHHKFKEFFQLDGEFRKYVTFAFVFNFAFMLASPFFTAYILNNLGQPYIIYAISTALTNLTKILMFPHIGRLSDKFGDKPVLLLSVMGTALVPLVFLFTTPATLWLLWVGQILSGIVWAGYDVAIFNVFLNLTTPEKRAVQNATYAIITSVPLIVAPILGGFIADHLVFFLAGIPLVFFLSMIARLLSSFLLWGIPERRIKHEYPLREVLMNAFAFHPSHGLQQRWLGVVQTAKKKGLLFLSLIR
jgi:MFS family permease